MPNGIQLQQNTRYANRFRRNTDNFIVVECDTNVVEAKCMDEIVDDEIVECKETIKNQKRDISNLRRDFNKIERKVFQLERENRELKKKQLKNRVIITEKQTKIDKMMIDNKKTKSKQLHLSDVKKEVESFEEKYKTYSSYKKMYEEILKDMHMLYSNRNFLKELHGSILE